MAPITGRFEADFLSFYAAVDKADAKLTDFQSGADKVGSSLNRMVDQFSGRQLIQQATVAAEAIERIGGASKLTEEELQKVAAKATEAAAKLRAMGVEVPANLQKIANELKPVNAELFTFAGVTDKIADMAIGGGLIGIGIAALDFAENLGKAEQALVRLSNDTQISIGDLQTLTAATQDYGLENDELAKALFRVSSGIAGGDESVARGLHEVGLSLEDVRGKHGKELFLDIESALGKLHGEMRDTAAAEIWGKKMGSALGGFAEDAEKAIDAASRLKQPTEDEVRALKDYADAVDRAGKTWDSVKTQFEGGIVLALESVRKATEQGVSWWKLFTAGMKDAGATLLSLPLADRMHVMNLELEAAAKHQADLTTETKTYGDELSNEQVAENYLAKLRIDGVKALEPYQVRALEELRAMGQLNEQNAAAVKITADQFKRYTEEVRAADAATKQLTASTAANKAEVDKLTRDAKRDEIQRTGTDTDIAKADLEDRKQAELDALHARTKAAKDALIQQHADSQEALAQLEADDAATTRAIEGHYAELADKVGTDWQEIRTHSQAALNDARDLAYNTMLAARSNSEISRAEYDKLVDKYHQAAWAATAAGQAEAASQGKAQAATEQTTKAIDDQITAQEKLKGVSASSEITAANFDTYTPPPDLSKDQIRGLLQQGFSLQNAVDILRAQKRGATIDLSQWSASARGPAVAGFGGGAGTTPTTTAAAAPIVLTAPPVSASGAAAMLSAAARAAGPATGAAGGITLHTQVLVSGVFDPSSAHALETTVSKAIASTVTNGRVLLG
jgi:hypothetical protein